MTKTWFITGASRGLGADLARAALKAGDRVVAAGRKLPSVTKALGPEGDSLLAVELDVTSPVQAKAAIDAAVKRFGGVDVLVNNAGYGHMGFFEENTLDEARAQFDTNVFGVFNVTWAALPVMRAARGGRILNVSSLAGIVGTEMGSFYCSSKFALEGFSEALAKEVAPFGILVTIVEPGPFRTEFLSADSIRFGSHPVADYDERRSKYRGSYERRHGKQPGDPVKLAEAMVRLTNEAKPPLRFLAGALAVEATDAKLSATRAELENWRTLSLSLDGVSSS